jgi:hypothetical protein
MNESFINFYIIRVVEQIYNIYNKITTITCPLY